MSGTQKIQSVMQGQPLSPPPLLPILHSALAPLAGVSLAEYYSEPECMARVAARAAEDYHLDGVQLSLGVTAEAQALGAAIVQPPDAAPKLESHILPDPATVDSLRDRDPRSAGRIPGHLRALRELSAAIGNERYILATVRGPLVIAAQLCGIETLMMTLMTDPETADRLLEFTTDTALAVGTLLAASGAHGVVLGEATCSPNFIAPDSYRNQIRKHHIRLVDGLHQAGWAHVGLHICGNILPIAEDIVATGVDFADVDFQTPLDKLLETVNRRIALRGNLDPSAQLRFATPEKLARDIAALDEAVTGHPWILSSGCDIPPGTPAENLHALGRQIATT